MKNIFKINMILIICLCIGFVFPSNLSVVRASSSYSSLIDGAKPDENSIPTTSSGVTAVIRRLLGFLQIASALMSILVIAFTGFQYIVAADAEMKNEMKKKMLPIIIGLILVFSASTITQFLLGVVNND